LGSFVGAVLLSPKVSESLSLPLPLTPARSFAPVEHLGTPVTFFCVALYASSLSPTSAPFNRFFAPFPMRRKCSSRFPVLVFLFAPSLRGSDGEPCGRLRTATSALASPFCSLLYARPPLPGGRVTRGASTSIGASRASAWPPCFFRDFWKEQKLDPLRSR